MKRLFFFILGICTFLSVAAQQDKESVPFNGIVEDALGHPLSGARVWVVSPNYYSRSDKKGKFGLTNVLPTDTIHVKYKDKVYSIGVDGKKSMRIRIADEVKVQEEEELVNTGYGFVKRREHCNSTSGISGDILVRTGRTNILDAMQGLVPGLTVSNGKALIRGINSINCSTDPLYIVDGIEVSSLDYVNVYDVDKVEVQKDANMYGARGANGVILVTTKRGLKKK